MPKLSLELDPSDYDLKELDILKLDDKSLLSWFSALQEMTRVFEAKELEQHLNLPITPELILAAVCIKIVRKIGPTPSELRANNTMRSRMTLGEVVAMRLTTELLLLRDAGLSTDLIYTVASTVYPVTVYATTRNWLSRAMYKREVLKKHLGGG